MTSIITLRTDDKIITKDVADKFMVKKKSNFTPNAGRDKCLDLYIDLVKDDVMVV